MSYFQLGAPDITPADLGHSTKDEIIADLRSRLADASRDIERLSAQVAALRAENRRLTTAKGLPPVGWLPPRPGVGKP